MGKQTNVPVLRFPEFKGEWERTPLFKIAEDGFSNGAFNDPKKVGSGYRIINVKDMYVDGTINVDVLTRVAIDQSEFLKNRVEYGDIFFTRSSIVKEGIAHSNVNLCNADDLTFDGHLIRMRPKKKEFDPVFLYYNFATPKARLQFVKRGKTTTMTTIGQNDIATVEIDYPTLIEQTKIANFITAVDTKLHALQKKKNLLEHYKKGIMQKLFSQELRFKDEKGKDFPDWKKKNGNLIFESISDKNHNSDLPILAITQEHGAIPRDLIDYSVSVTDKSIESYKVVQVGDYIISLRSFQGGIEYSDYKGICSPAYIILRPTIPINNMFFKRYFKTGNYIKELQKNLEGIRDGKMISYKYFSDIKLPYPTIEEQTKIANFLSAIDDKINHCQTQIKNTGQYKKGLLQNMFI